MGFEGIHIMKKNVKNFYGFDEKYEFLTYKRIGSDYGKPKNGEEKYSICNTYSEWENHVKSTLPLGILNYEDFIHWLNRHLQNAKVLSDVVKLAVIPTYILMISLAIELDNKFVMAFVIMVCILLSISYCYKYERKVHFWDDYINIAKKYRTID